MISVSMICKDGAKDLPRSLGSIKDLADEIVFVDTGSTDDSVKIAESFGAKIFRFEWVNDFSKARNAALEKCSGDWVFTLDADEEVPESTVKLIRELAQGEKQVYLAIVRQLDGSEHWANARFFPREGAKWQYRVHEQVVYPEDVPNIVHGKLLVLHHGIITREKGIQYGKMAEQEYKSSPDRNNLLQYAFGMQARKPGSMKALNLLIKAKRQMPKGAGGGRALYREITRWCESRLILECQEAERKGYGGLWGACKVAEMLFVQDRPEDCLRMCQHAKTLPYDGFGTRESLLNRIAFLEEWSAICLGLEDTYYADKDRDPDHLSELVPERMDGQQRDEARCG